VVGAAVTAIVAALLAARPGFVANIDYRVCDLLAEWIGPGEQSRSVAVVNIDEDSLRRYGRWPWHRDLLGALVRSVADAGAATVVLDLLMSEPDRGKPSPGPGALPGATDDDVLARSLALVPTVLGYSLRFGAGSSAAPDCNPPALPLAVARPEHGGEAFFHASGIECTVPVLSHAAAGSGFLNAAPDPDGKMRDMPLIAEDGGRYYPSLALAAMDTYQHVSRMEFRADARGAAWLRLNSLRVPLEGHSTLRLRYRGPHQTFPYVSAADLLGGRAPAGKLRGKIAVIGASAPGLPNAVATPADPALPGPELYATAIDDLLQGDFFHRPSDGIFWEVLIALAAGIASILTLTWMRSIWAGVIILSIAVAVWMGCAAVLSTSGALLSPLPAMGVLACNFVALTLINYRTERRRAERTERQLSRARKKTERIRQESETRYQRLVENVSDAIITDDASGRLLFANRRFREWFDLQNRQIDGLVLEDYVAPEWRETVREHRRLRLKGHPVPEHIEFQGIRADGSRIWIEAVIATVEEGGRIVGTQSALRDVTERKRLEAQYLQAQKMESVGRLAAGIAHDFNNLLTVINGYSEMLASKLHENRSLLELVQQIRSAGGRAAELTMQLLTFSRKQAAQRKPLDLNLVVEDAQKMLRRVVGEDVELQSRLGPSLGQVLADPGQVQQVLMNLVVNARDSMPDGGKLVLQTANVELDEAFSKQHPEVPPGRYVYLGVTDTGTGMTEEIKRQIFEPFFTTKEKGKGTGLGLTTVYNIVRQCEGGIWVESEAGLGTTFHIYLPRTESVAQAAGAAAEAATVGRGVETLLLVEDQDAVRRMIEAMLKDHGYQVLHAPDGAQAVALAERYPGAIHLLIADVILPGMNGRALAEALRRSRPEMKVMYISGYSEEIIERQGVLDSSVAYLAKPFTRDSLVSKVREALAGGAN
jgi:PAS domain S-box-containing protein